MGKNLLKALDEESLAIVRMIGQLAQRAGMKAYLVGGPVRDLMLIRSNTDLDITVEGYAIKLAEKFARANPKSKIVRYPAFKTATVYLFGGRAIDFATARKEVYPKPGAMPLVTPSDIKDDLFRRDFTVNAMAIAINTSTEGNLVDPFGGQEDVRAKQIRILHSNSFTDDPTRIFRAARFMGRLGFKMEPGTLECLKAAMQAKVLDTIKLQRYKKDLDKILNEHNPAPAMECLKFWGVLKGEVNAH